MASSTCDSAMRLASSTAMSLGVFVIGTAIISWHRAARAACCRPRRRTFRCRRSGRGYRSNASFDLPVDHLGDQVAAIDAVENPLAVAVNPLPLLVHHLVVFEQVLADFEVPLLDLLLSAFDAAGNHAAFDGFAFLHAEAGEQVLHPLAGEDPHQVVFEREIEAAAAGVALPAATAAKLQVDAAGLVPLGADDVQAAELLYFLPFGLHVLALFDFGDQVVPFFLGHVEPGGVFVLQQGPGHRLGIAAEDDVGAAAGHVRGDRHGGLAAGLGDDLGLALVVLGVEHLVLDAALVEQAGNPLALFDRHGADEHRPAASLDIAGSFALGIVAACFELCGTIVIASSVSFSDRAGDELAIVLEHLIPAVEPLDFVGDGGELFLLAAVDDVGMNRALQGSCWSARRSRRACRSSRIRRLR